MPDPVTPVPVTPRIDDTVADAVTLEDLGVVDPQPTPDPDPPPVATADGIAADETPA